MCSSYVFLRLGYVEKEARPPKLSPLPLMFNTSSRLGRLGYYSWSSSSAHGIEVENLNSSVDASSTSGLNLEFLVD
jgi:hypothetical protein